jgi:putative chitinase
MPRPPGPLCGYALGPDWIDRGTCALTRMPAPGPIGVADAHLSSMQLSPTEQRMLASLDLAGIGDLHERAMFLAQLNFESAGFLKLRESLKYSGKRLRQVFPKRFHGDEDAESVAARGPAGIAERLYGDRSDNTESGDGLRFIGRGYIQLTGRGNYTDAGRALSLDLVNNPELAADPGIAVLIALWYWRSRDIGPPARAADVTRVTFLINGGGIGLPERRALFRHYAKRLAALFPWHVIGLRGIRPW